MTLSVRFFYSLLALALCANLSGCLPSGGGQAEEEKEAHFVEGKSCLNRMDFKGAIQEFEKALEVNPHSAAAHFQLAWLYEEKVPDPAAAIYHWQQFLKLRPDYPNAETIKQHIVNCKQDLAKTVLPLPITPTMQREFQQLAEQNKLLQTELEQWKTYAARLQLMTNRLQVTAGAQQPVVPPSPPAQPMASRQQTSAAQVEHPSAAARTYKVQAGDNPSAIARKFNVKLDAFMSANPGLEPKRLHIGQTVNIPSP